MTAPAVGTTTEQQPTDTAPGTERGYPEGTPLEQMTPDQREAYWRHHSRHWESRAKQAPSVDELKDLRTKAAEFDKVRQAQMTELEKANATIAELQVKTAGFELTEMRRQAAKAAGLPTDDAEFITAATPEDAKAQAERLKERLGTAGTGTGTDTDGHDQGHRRQQKPSGKDAGLAEARRRFGNPTTPTA